jgi:hypothetical protein
MPDDETVAERSERERRERAHWWIAEIRKVLRGESETTDDHVGAA